MWCGTTLTDDRHRRFRAMAVAYGHLHIPRTSWRDEVRFEEVSAGERLGSPAGCLPLVSLRQVLPHP